MQRQTYRLELRNDAEQPARVVEFQAADLVEALVLAHGEARQETAELWRGGTKLCTISRGKEGSFNRLLS